MSSAESDTAGRVSTPSPKSSQLNNLSLAPVDPTIELDTSQQLTATGTYSDGTSQVVTESVAWDSSNDDVATVSGGLVTAEGTGTSTITATSKNDIKATIQVAVPTLTAQLTNLSLAPNDPTIELDTSQQLTATGTYSDGTSQVVTESVAWDSSNDDVATVSGGLVTAEGTGTSTITATSKNDIKATIQVTVPTSQRQLTRIDVDGESSQVCPSNETLQLTAIGTYSDGTTEGIANLVSWKSSDLNFATVDDAGLVKPQGPEDDPGGSAVITATSGSLSDSFKVSCSSVQ